MRVDIDRVPGCVPIPSSGKSTQFKGRKSPLLPVEEPGAWSLFLQLGWWGERRLEKNSEADKGTTTVLSSESLGTVLTCMFRNYPLGEEDRQNKCRSNRNQN